MKSIILIGMPGAGKTTVGKILSRQMGLPFIDTDSVIEEREGKPLQRIFDERGLENFKNFEGEVVASLDFSGHIIATGGSVIYSDKAMRKLKSLGTLVFIHVTPGELIRRVDNTETRGMVKRPGMSLKDLYGERDPLYRAEADCIIEGSNTTPESMADEIISFIKSGKCDSI